MGYVELLGHLMLIKLLFKWSLVEGLELMTLLWSSFGGRGLEINDFIMVDLGEGRYEAFDGVVLSFYIVIHRDDAN